MIARRGIVLSAAVAALATVLALYRPSLAPPALHPRSVQVATAATELLVAPANLSIGTQNAYAAAVDHAILLADVMATPPVVDYAARQLGISSSQIQATVPMTANVPRVVSDPGSGEASYNLARSTAPFKLEVQPDPTIPILHVYTQAPTTSEAIRLAAAASEGLKLYADAGSRGPAGTGTRIHTLGPIRGAVANSGGRIEIGLLVFLGTLGVVIWLTFVAKRVRAALTTTTPVRDAQ